MSGTKRGANTGVDGQVFDVWMKQLAEGQQAMRSELLRGLDEVKDRLDSINGRVGKTEQEVAVLRDRSASEQQERRDERWRTMLWGGGGGGALIGAIELLKALFRK